MMGAQQMDYKRIAAIAAEKIDDAVALAQRMIRIRSLSGQEREMAELVQNTMVSLGYDEVTVDEAGNVIGLIRGTGGGKSIMFNCHFDTVDCGELSRWKHDPFAGDVADGMLWGLGASDTKGAFACQLVAAAALKQAGFKTKGDVYVVGVVHEESSGFGSTFLAPKLATDVVILGEASENQLKVGHRGRLQFDIHLKGQSVHASAPERGVNPHFTAARLLLAIESMQMKSDAFFGSSSAAPTLYVTDQTSSNVTPGEVTVSLDWRNIPAETDQDIRALLEKLLSQCLQPGITAEIELKMRDVVCYTGLKGRALAGEPSYATPPDDSDVLKAQAMLATGFGRDVNIELCRFATDGGHFRSRGSKVIIFAPSGEAFCHTSEDSVSIASMQEAILGNMLLALGLTEPE